ncbi:MAG: hypothetical protein ACLQME_11020 [Alphaproteobacteria bacterium]
MSIYEDAARDHFRRTGRRARILTKAVLSDLSLVDHGAGLGCHSVLAKSADGERAFSESDRVGVQDDRDAQARVDDMQRVTAAAVNRPPARGEVFEAWVDRLFGKGADQLHGEELQALKNIFLGVRQHGSITKGIASALLEELVDRNHAANPQFSRPQVYSEVCKRSPEAQSLYKTMRTGIVDGRSGVDYGLSEIAKAESGTDGDGSGENEAATQTPEEADDEESADAAQFLDDRAAEIQAAMPHLSAHQAWARAATQHPAKYAVAYRHKKVQPGGPY